MSQTDPEEILDLLYEEIHKFLVSQVGEDLDHDIIDINLESQENEGLKIEISLDLRIRAFSDLNVEEIAEKAIAHGIKIADEVCPSFTKIHGHLRDK